MAVTKFVPPSDGLLMKYMRYYLPDLRSIESNNPYGGQRFVFSNGDTVEVSESFIRICGTPEAMLAKVKELKSNMIAGQS